MNNVAQFSLGLAAGTFLSTISQATRGVSGLVGAGLRIPVIGTAIGGLVGSIASLGGVITGTFGAIEKGTELNGLHKRTGETVSDLYAMEKGFKAVHLPADGLGTMIFHLQKALGGFNEMGEPTKDIFAGIGLSVEDLKTKRAPEQLEAITGALAKLNKEEAATAAGKIFGRGGAADALQIARSGTAFSDAMKASAEQGALFARNAERFEKIELSIGRLKSKFNGMFANIAEGAAPGIQAFLDKLNGIDISGFSSRVGKIITLFARSWQSANFGDIVGLTLQAGFEKAINWLWAAFKAFAAALPQIIDAGKKGVTSAADEAVALAKEIAAAQIGERINKLPANSEEFQAGFAHQQQLQDEAAGFRAKAKAGMDAALANLGQSVSEAIAADKSNLIPETASKRLKELLDKVVMGALGTEPAGTGGKLSALGGGGSRKQTEANALERVGAMFARAGGGSVTDYSRETANNTARTNQLLGDWLRKNQGNYTDSFGGKHSLSLNL